MRRTALLILTLIASTLCLAQGKPSPATPAAPKLETFQVTPEASVQYDPAVWQRKTVGNGDEAMETLILLKDGKPTETFIQAKVFTEPDKTFKEMFSHAREGALSQEGSLEMELSGFVSQTEKGIFFSYLSAKSAAVVSWYSFPGETADVDSHTAIVFVAVFPMAAIGEAGDNFKPIDAVIATFTIRKPGTGPNTQLPEGR
jgi:hypothetical protein